MSIEEILPSFVTFFIELDNTENGNQNETKRKDSQAWKKTEREFFNKKEKHLIKFLKC